MTVWNEFLGGFQQNMRNDYARQNLKVRHRERERLQRVVQKDEFAADGCCSPEQGGWEEMNKNDTQNHSSFKHDGMGSKDCLILRVQGHGRAYSLIHSPVKPRRKKNGVSLCLRHSH